MICLRIPQRQFHLRGVFQAVTSWWINLAFGSARWVD